eukprot:m.236718 g.236718  ORF g.236718 m.236718 type:complete len:273 (-) comp13016_c0_seq1:267-1085(-)
MTQAQNCMTYHVFESSKFRLTVLIRRVRLAAFVEGAPMAEMPASAASTPSVSSLWRALKDVVVVMREAVDETDAELYFVYYPLQASERARELNEVLSGYIPVQVLARELGLQPAHCKLRVCLGSEGAHLYEITSTPPPGAIILAQRPLQPAKTSDGSPPSKRKGLLDAFSSLSTFAVLADEAAARMQNLHHGEGSAHVYAIRTRVQGFLRHDPEKIGWAKKYALRIRSVAALDAYAAQWLADNAYDVLTANCQHFAMQLAEYAVDPARPDVL